MYLWKTKTSSDVRRGKLYCLHTRKKWYSLIILFILKIFFKKCVSGDITAWDHTDLKVVLGGWLRGPT